MCPTRSRRCSLESAIMAAREAEGFTEKRALQALAPPVVPDFPAVSLSQGSRRSPPLPHPWGWPRDARDAMSQLGVHSGS